MTRIHPAIAEHAIKENPALHARIAELEAQVAALSQQAEPKCDTCHGQGEVWTGENQSFGYMSMQPPEPIMEVCPECAGEAEPAPAQDERGQSHED